MPCYKPNNVRYHERRIDGKKQILFEGNTDWPVKGTDNFRFYKERRSVRPDDGFTKPMQLPCGKCTGCLLARSQQWAVRCSQEASMYAENCFVTLTFNQESLERMCPDGSLMKWHMREFFHKLRRRFKGRKIRYFYCGEYGPLFGRPHYHILLFNLDFPDKYLWRVRRGIPNYRSPILEEIWPYGNSEIGAVNYETSAYVARYCLKKANFKDSEERYQRIRPQTGEIVTVLPEFSQPSLKPGIGKPWLDYYGLNEVYNDDRCPYKTKTGSKLCRPPRYYDKLLERQSPELFAKIKAERERQRVINEEDNTFERLLVKQKVQELKLQRLVRDLERGT